MGKVKDREEAFKRQNYEDLRKHHQEEKTLFIDPTFPAVDAIIGTSSIPPNIQWKRPAVSRRLVVVVDSKNWILSNTLVSQVSS